jgi:Na+/H+-dicarboxylate symporter
MSTAPEKAPEAPAPWGDVARSAGLYGLVAVALGLVLTATTDGPFLARFTVTTTPLVMLALTVAAQRRGILTGIVTGLCFAFLGVALFGGAMATYAWIGKFFISSLKMLIAPLVAFAMITAVAGLGDVRRLGRLSRETVVYFLVTTVIAVALGSVLVNLFAPGEGLAPGTLHVPEKVANKQELGLTDLVLSFVSDNIIKSFVNLEMLPIIVFSLAFGAVLTTLGPRGRAVLDFCEGGNEAMMKLVHLVLMLAPVGVFGLIGGRFGQELAKGSEQFWAMITAVGGYSATVVVGLGIHGAVILPLFIRFVGKRSPVAVARGVGKALFTAFSTASSAATIPVTLEGVEEELKVSKRTSRFVVPLGATVNMNGTALYESVAVIFIAQAVGLELTFAQQVLIVITATLAAIGAAGIPEAGLVTMVMVLQAAKVPVEGVELILAVDWLLDRFRTTVNVWGDVAGAVVIEARLGPPEPEATR